MYTHICTPTQDQTLQGSVRHGDADAPGASGSAPGRGAGGEPRTDDGQAAGDEVGAS